MIGLFYSLKELKKEYSNKTKGDVANVDSDKKEKSFSCPYCKNNKRKRDQNRSPFFTLKYSIIKGLFNLFKWCNSVRVVRGPKREPQNSVVSFAIRSF